MERRGKVNSKVRMEQGLEPAARAESHQAIQRKTSQNQADTTSQREPPQLQTEGWGGRKEGIGKRSQGERTVVGKNRREREAVGQQERAAQWFGKGGKSASIKPAKLEFSNSE